MKTKISLFFLVLIITLSTIGCDRTNNGVNSWDLIKEKETVTSEDVTEQVNEENEKEEQLEEVIEEEKSKFVTEEDIRKSLLNEKIHETSDNGSYWIVEEGEIQKLEMLNREYDEESNQEDITIYIELYDGTNIIKGKLDLVFKYNPEDYSDYSLAWIDKHNGEYFSIYKLEDVVDWTFTTLDNSTLGDINWNGEQFLTVGTNGSIYISKDGQNWEYQESGTKDKLYKIVWNGEQYLVVTYDKDYVLLSKDGIEWEKVTIDGSRLVRRVLWDGVKYSAFSNVDGVFCSRDGKAWRNENYEWSLSSSIVYDGNRYVKIGEGGYTNFSEDAINWSEEQNLQTINSRDVFNGFGDTILAWDGKEYLLSMRGGTMWYSDNAINWTRKDDKEYDNDKINNLIYSNSKYIRTGNNGVIIVSDDGYEWEKFQPSSFTIDGKEYYANNIYSGTWVGDKLIVVGSATGDMGNRSLIGITSLRKNTITYEYKDGVFIKVEQ